MADIRAVLRRSLHDIICLGLLFLSTTKAGDKTTCPETWGIINDTALENFEQYKDCFTTERLLKMKWDDLQRNRSEPWCPPGLAGEELLTIQACKPCDIPGYFCIAGQSLPCMFGSYCPDTTQMLTCPKGKLCLPMTVEPVTCPRFKRCAEGAQNIYPDAEYHAPVAFVVVLILWLSCAISRRRVRGQRSADKIAEQFGGEFLLAHKDTFQKTATKVDIAFKDIGLKLKSNGATILSGVTGRFPAASVVALMGPSGSGKTTFMSVLLGRAYYGKTTGRVWINGQSAALFDTPSLVGFVPQDDIVHADLTVYQNLYYSAQLRLPASVSRQDKEKHIDYVVSVLGMKHVQHNLVGSPEKRGISGGQKKRVNIGMELAAMPAVLFMDEPTSGLDASAAGQVMSILADLAKSGMSVVCVIHQPRKDVFYAFSHLMLLGAGGRMVYCGRQEFAKQYLTSLGFRLPAEENPADWIIDVVSGLSARYDPSGQKDTQFTAPKDLFARWEQQGSAELAQWKRGDPEESLTPLIPRTVPSRLKQTVTLGQRCLSQHDNRYFLQMLGLMFAIGVFIGYFNAILMPQLLGHGKWYTYTQLDVYLSGGPLGSLLFPAGVTIIATYLYGPKRLLYMREFSSGISAFAYWASHSVYYTLIWDLFLPAILTLPVYGSMVVMQPLGHYMLVNIVAAWYYSSVGMLFSIIIQNQMACFTLFFFLPIVESMLGRPTVPGMSQISKCLGIRWLVVARLSGEVEFLPDPVQQIAARGHMLNGGSLAGLAQSAVKLPLARWEMSTNYDEERAHALQKVFLIGLILRVAVLVCLLVSKYDINCARMIWQFAARRTMPEDGDGALRK